MLHNVWLIYAFTAFIIHMDAITRHAFTVFALQDTTSAVLAQNFFSLIMRIELLHAAQDSHFKAVCFFLIKYIRLIQAVLLISGDIVDIRYGCGPGTKTNLMLWVYGPNWHLLLLCGVGAERV